MKLNLVNGMNTAEQITQMMQHIESTRTGIANNPPLNQSPAQINRTMEISRDPPSTVVKYTNAVTKEVELQIPSEVSLRIYKSIQEFEKGLAAQKNSISIKV